MSDDDEFSRVAEIERAAKGKPSYLDMDAAFCARMYAAITAGLAVGSALSMGRADHPLFSTRRTARCGSHPPHPTPYLCCPGLTRPRRLLRGRVSRRPALF